MILYHGSNNGNSYTGYKTFQNQGWFGKWVLYHTDFRAGARLDAGKFPADAGENAVISVFNFDETALEKVNFIQFDSYSESWLDFVLHCRTGKDNSDYDIVIGGVANDKVFNTVELFFDGLIEKSEH